MQEVSKVMIRTAIELEHAAERHKDRSTQSVGTSVPRREAFSLEIGNLSPTGSLVAVAVLGF